MQPIGKINVYHCPECHSNMVFIHRDDGVTPFLVKCDRMGVFGKSTTPKPCPGMAMSQNYLCDQKLDPEYEWYRPAEDDPLMKDECVRNHVSLGGLMPRTIKGGRFTG